MPCPFFEPFRIAAVPSHAEARLPLIDEYDGVCHALEPSTPAPAHLRFRCCNHGYSRGECTHLPAHQPFTALRYHVTQRTAEVLELLCIEEVEHRPGRLVRFTYLVAAASLEPADGDVCLRAQAAAFCRSYLQHFAS